jgi:small-conductance mechanosensitive channel
MFRELLIRTVSAGHAMFAATVPVAAPVAVPAPAPSPAPTATPAASAAPGLSPPPVAPIAPAEASAHLQHRLVSRWDTLHDALQSGNFYIEIALIVAALILAGVVAKFVVARIRARLEKAPPKFIDIEYLTRPLLLLGPTTALIFLKMVEGMLVGLGIGGDLTGGVVELVGAYWLTKCVFLIVRSRPVAYLASAAIIINAILRAARINRSVSAWLDSIGFDLGQYHFTVLHLVQGIVIFVVVFWGAGLLSETLESYLRRSTRLSPNTRHLTAKFFRIFVYVVAAAITLSAVGIDLTAFAIFTGALGVGIGLGLQKLTANFVSGVTVLMERSIKIGDLVEVSGQSGWVRQLNIRYMLMETSDGREILIPNEELVSSRVINWTLTTNLARLEIKIGVAFESDPEKARDLILEAALENPRCLRDPEPSCWLREFGDHGYNFTLGFWIADVTEGLNAPQSEVMFAILRKFRENGITLAHA